MGVKLMASHILATYSATEMCTSHQTQLSKNLMESSDQRLGVVLGGWLNLLSLGQSAGIHLVQTLGLQDNWKGRDWNPGPHTSAAKHHGSSYFHIM